MDLSRRNFVKLGALAPLAYSLPRGGNHEFIAGLAGKSLKALYRDFQNPTAAARPFVRWWWNGERVVAEELLRELDMLKEKGISGVEINSIEFPQGDDPMNYKACDWLSDEWMKMVEVTVDGAKKRGLTCDIIMGSGWPFGGEFLTRDEQIQLMALGTRNLKGPATVKIPRSELVDEMKDLTLKGDGYLELSHLRLAPGKMDSFTPGVDLDDQLGNEEISVKVPAGDHVLYYLVRLTGFTVVTHGAPGASGPVLNHYNKKAVTKYIDRMSDAIHAKLGGMGNRFRSVFIDSLELHGSNWCDDMAAEFSKRRGYDVMPYLPFILFKINPKSKYNGNHVTTPYGTVFSDPVREEIERVRYDFETTRLELFQERFLETFIDWCRANGVKSRVQCYGREYFPLEAPMKVDIPECETWLRADVGHELPENTFGKGRAYRPVNKWASSAARLTGKREVSCEEQTNTAVVFNATLERIKITGDQSNLSGVTHSVLHGFNYSPKDVPFPGWVRYGTFFNERNTWWPYLRKWVDYKSRLSQIFQDGVLQSDIAILFPLADLWSRFGVQYEQYPQTVYPSYADNIWEAIHQNGSGCDYLDEHIVQKAKTSGGALSYGPRSYKVLLLPRVRSVAPETAEALQAFAAGGGKLIFVGEVPSRCTGKVDHEAGDKRVSETMKKLRADYPDHAILVNEPEGPIIEWFAAIQQKCGLAPFVRFDHPVNHVSQVHYKASDADIYFIANYDLDNPHAFTATFNPAGKTPWIWNPETGEKFRYPSYGDMSTLKISLDPAASVLIVYTPEKKGPEYVPRQPLDGQSFPLSGTWDLTLEKVYDKPRDLPDFTLHDFKDDPALNSFAGVIHYKKSFKVGEASAVRYLDLGTVHGISEVTLNGKTIGAKWYGYHVYDVTGVLRTGINTLDIKVTTVLGNYAKSLKENVVAQQWTRKQPLYSMGMLGPVRFV